MNEHIEQVSLWLDVKYHLMPRDHQVLGQHANLLHCLPVLRHGGLLLFWLLFLGLWWLDPRIKVVFLLLFLGFPGFFLCLHEVELFEKFYQFFKVLWGLLFLFPDQLDDIHVCIWETLEILLLLWWVWLYDGFLWMGFFLNWRFVCVVLIRLHDCILRILGNFYNRWLSLKRFLHCLRFFEIFMAEIPLGVVRSIVLHHWAQASLMVLDHVTLSELVWLSLNR